MTFFESIAACFSRYADFDGRASRPEFWWFILFIFLADSAAGIVDQSNGWRSGGPIAGLFSVAIFLPLIAVGARRLHDIGNTGWWLLIAVTGIGLIPLVYWWCQPATMVSTVQGGVA